MSKFVLYAHIVSPPCRAVMMVAEALGVPYDMHEINLRKMEHMEPEFLKINPLHMIPTLKENDFILGDSHAIMTYLVGTYGKDDSLYPKDLKQRALVDQFLHYDNGTLFATIKSIFKPVFYYGEKTFRDGAKSLVEDCYKTLNKVLENKEWLVGNSYTLADISCMTSTTSMTVICPLDDYPHVKAWMARCEKHIPGYLKVNEPGHKVLVEQLKAKMSE